MHLTRLDFFSAKTGILPSHPSRLQNKPDRNRNRDRRDQNRRQRQNQGGRDGWADSEIVGTKTDEAGEADRTGTPDDRTDGAKGLSLVTIEVLEISEGGAEIAGIAVYSRSIYRRVDGKISTEKKA
jgi:hypothetical protein